MNGEALVIEFGDGGKTERFEVTAGGLDWSEPSDRPTPCNPPRTAGIRGDHNLLDRPDAVAQPSAEPE